MADYKCGLTRNQLEEMIERGALLGKGGKDTRIGNGSVSQTSRGYWRMQLTYTEPKADEDGKRKQYKVSRLSSVPCKKGNTTGKPAARAELVVWRADVIADLRTIAGQTADATSCVPDYVSSFVDSRAHKVVQSTLTSYRNDIHYLRMGGLQDIAIESLTEKDVKRWIIELSGKYAPQTIRKSFRLLDRACREAVHDHDLAINPCDYTKELLPETKKPKPNALDEDGVRAVNAYLVDAKPTALTACVALALHCGLRAEEAAGLTWGKVKLEYDQDGKPCGGTIVIDNVIGRHGHGQLFEKTPKSDAGERTLYLDELTARILAARQAAMQEEAMKLEGVKFTGADYVCGTIRPARKRDGEPCMVPVRDSRKGAMKPRKYADPHALTEQWTKLAGKAPSGVHSDKAVYLGLVGTNGDNVTLHDLRHTYATHALMSGVNIRSLADLMGHQDPAVTVRYYGTVLKKKQLEASKTIAAALSLGTEEAEVVSFKKTGTEG